MTENDPVRVVSLVPSHTAALAAVGAELVGATRYCTEPPDLDVARVGGTKTPDLDAVVALAPDVVVMNEEENRARDAERLRAAGVDVVVTFPRTVDAGIDSIDALAERVGCGAVGRRLTGGLRADLAALRGDVVPGDRGVVVCPIWRRSAGAATVWMTFNSDTYAHDVLTTAGGVNAFADAPDRYPEFGSDDVDFGRADTVLLPDEPYEFDAAHAGEVEALGTRAVLCSGRDLHWYGPECVAGIRRIRSRLARV